MQAINLTPLSPSHVYRHTFTVHVFSTEIFNDIDDELSKGLHDSCLGFKDYRSSYVSTSIVPKTQDMIEREQRDQEE